LRKREHPPGFYKETLGREAHSSEAQIPEKPTPETKVPKTLTEARQSRFWKGFEGAIRDELTSLEENKTWEYVPRTSLPKDTNILRAKFVFDIKRNSKGMGYTQIEGVDYNETSASVMISKSFRILLTIWNMYPKMQFEHWDIKTAFVNAPLNEMVYCRQIPGFEKQGTEGMVLRLRKALYGTKQAANAWQKFLASILIETGAKRCYKDECVYLFREGKAFMYLSTHVDDIFPLYNEEGKMIRDRVLKTLKSRMQVEEKGEIEFALDTKIQRDVEKGILKISQTTYTENILKEFLPHGTTGRDTPAVLSCITEDDLPKTDEQKAEVASLPHRKVIGKLWWLALVSRPDIQCALHRCAVWADKPSKKLWNNLIHILLYLRNTPHLGLVYTRHQESANVLSAYCDASYRSEGGKSRWGYFFFFSGALVSWNTKHTTRLVSSSTEAETYGLIHAGKENIWMRQMLSELRITKDIEPTRVFNDNKPALSLASGAPCHKRSKHFEHDFEILKEYIQLKEMTVSHIGTDELPADILTKPLPPDKCSKFREMIMGDEKLQRHFDKKHT